MQSKLSKEQIKDIIQWDISNWKKALSFWEQHYKITPGMKVLALGERGGGLSLYFALMGCDVVCSDYREFQEVTKKLHEKHGVSSRITYAQADIRKLDFEDQRFDIVVFKSVMGAIDTAESQLKSINEINRVLKKGGAFLFAENSTASFFHRRMRKFFVKWETKWRYISDAEFKNWKVGFSQTFSAKKGLIALFGRTENQRKFLSYPDAFFASIVPKSWRYIYLGAFIK
jgi:ubiquinone/menaquinone biosynthesis C-methylase UbiE